MTTKNIIDSIVDKVIIKVNKNWSDLQKIRFVYLELGKYLEKNTDFFLNEKLESLKLEHREIMRIYEKDKINISKRKTDEPQYQIICKSAARFLKTAFDRLNIKSSYIHTVGEDNTILHWFIVVSDGNNQYFLTLAADLPFIKNDMPTIHFANHISYLNENGEETYVIPNENLLLNKIIYKDDNGNEKEAYEISHTELTLDELKQLDTSIGYSRLYDIGEKELSTLPQLYMTFKETEHEIFNIFKNSFNIDETLSKRIDSIKESEVLLFKTEIYKYITNKLDEILKINNNNDSINFEERFKIYIIKILESLGIKNIDNNLTTIDLIKNYKKLISKNKDYVEVTNIIKYLSEIINRFDNYINIVKESDDFIINCKKYIKEKNLTEEKDIQVFIHNKLEQYKIDINKAKKELSIQNLNHLFYYLISYFIKDEIIVDKSKDYVTLDYIVNKFCYMFPIMFEWNYLDNEYIKETKFSIQNYSEQIVIIKLMLKILFPELSEKNCKQMEGYETKYSPVENRIQTYPLKNKKTKEYCIGFSFKGIDEENEVQFIYIPSENLLRESDPLQDRRTYQIVSRRFNDRLSEIEDINKPNIYVKKI